MRWRTAGAILLLVGSAFLEGAGLLLLVPLLGAIGLDVQQGAVGRLAALVARGFDTIGVTPTLPLVLLVFVGVTSALAGVRRVQTILTAAVEQDVVHRTRVRLYASLLRMQWLALSRHRGSDLTVALTSEADRVGMAASQVLTILGSTVVMLVYIALAWRVSPLMTSGVLGCGLVLVVLLRRRTQRSEAIGRAFSDATHDFQAAVSDDLGGLKTIRSVGAEPRSVARFESVSHRIGHVRRQSTAAYAASTFWMEIGSAATLSVLVAVAIVVLRFNASALLLLLFVFARVVPRLATLQQNIQFYLHVLPSYQRMLDLQGACDAAAEPAALSGPPLALTDRVRLRDVSFGYDGTGVHTLDAIDLDIRAGSIVAIVGPSGAGKTTLVDILLALLQPDSGHVEIDGRPLDPANAARWRASVAYVPQDTFLFHGSIRANMQWAVPGTSDDQIWEALDTAAAGFVRGLPSQLDTVVGDRGMRLSGGERQRLALARALLRRPALLVLDEATSALDAETEARILDTIWRLRGALTVVIVTHRVASVAGADTLHVLESGRLVESGRWQELVDRPAGRLRALLPPQDVRTPSPA